MTSKKKYNSPFRKTFAFGMLFFLAVGILLTLLLVGGIRSYLSNRNVSPQVENHKQENFLEQKDKREKHHPDTVYKEKIVFEKCNRKHCEDEISTLSSPTEPERQHDSTTN